MMKNTQPTTHLPAKQSRWEISLHNARDLPLDLTTRQPKVERR